MYGLTEGDSTLGTILRLSFTFSSEIAHLRCQADLPFRFKINCVFNDRRFLFSEKNSDGAFCQGHDLALPISVPGQNRLNEWASS